MSGGRRGGRERVVGFDPCGGFLGGGEAAFELSVLDFCEDDGHAGAAGVAHGEEVAAGEEPGGEGSGSGGVGEGLVHEFPVIEEPVAAEAVDAVEFEFVWESGLDDPAFDLGRAHVADVHEFHVIGDGGGGGVDDLVRAAETAEDVGGHFCAEFVMAVEADAAFCGVAGPCGGFGDVVEEDGEDERGGDDVGEKREHESGVDPDIAFRVVFGWLGAAFEGFHFGEEDLEETGGIEEIEAADPVRMEHDSEEFVADAFDADGG